MNRYIDADHLKSWLLARWEEIDPKSENPFKMADIFNQIDYGELSINIVRCKECKWVKWNSRDNRYECFCHIPIFAVQADGYCNLGELKGKSDEDRY